MIGYQHLEGRKSIARENTVTSQKVLVYMLQNFKLQMAH
jgi:hypothetical protein